MVKKNEAFHFIHKIASISSYSNEYFFLILPLFTTDVDVIHYEELKYLFHETLNNVEDRTEFLESFTVYCCKNNLCNMGIELLHLYLDDDDLYPTLVYYLAALHYVNSENNKGNEFLKLALLINYDYWIEFMALHEILNEIPSIKELIELYRPV